MWALTATGHSLGGALAVLTAWDAAEALSSGGDRVPVSAVTFGAPRVGNWAFRDELVASRAVSVLRVVVKQDVVPLTPLANLGYVHAGKELVLDADRSPDLKILNRWCFHSLELYMRLLDGRERARGPGALRWDKEYCVMPAPEPDRDDIPLEESELDQMISADKLDDAILFV